MKACPYVDLVNGSRVYRRGPYPFGDDFFEFYDRTYVQGECPENARY